jgi:hypothetical protein
MIDQRRAAPISTGRRWHRPLVWLAVAMTALAVASAVGLLVDHREVTGVNLWLKPLKFAISIAIYAVTLSWLIGQLQRMRRLASIAGTVSVIGLLIEIVIIVGVAATGETSHFNVSTPFHAVLWSVMAASIVTVWIMTLVVAIALFRADLGDRGRVLAIRAGVVIALIGMALAFLMTGPTADQLDSYQGIVGAHTVGIADGGPGIPVLGWSTVAGDLRIPHFIGMHALQVLPIAVIILEWLGRRLDLVTADIRYRLMVVVTVAYAAVVVIVTWQALAGQSIVRPSGGVLVAGITVTAALVAWTVLALVIPARGESPTARSIPQERVR